MIAPANQPFEPKFASDEDPPAAFAKTRPFYWSVRREIWEVRAIYAVPLAIAAAVLFGFLLSTAHLPRALRAVAAGDHKAASALIMPYAILAIALMVNAVLTSAFYSAGALHGERRDRSMLFWKSLPVSDRVTVLSKAIIPLAVVPAVAFGVIAAAQILMLAWSTVVTVANGYSAPMLWQAVHVPTMLGVLAYGLALNAVWQAPLFAWFILVSAWARRTPMAWALAPAVVPAIVERMAFGTAHYTHFLMERVFGGFGQAFSAGGEGKKPVEGLNLPDILRALLLPDIWLGLVFAAACLAAAIWLRRRREPL